MSADEIFVELAALPEVEAVALGGSRASGKYDEKSDYDVYVYILSDIPEETRRAILSKYCSAAEIGNRFWETEDNVTLSDGTDMDIIYRRLDDFAEEVADVAERFSAHNGYTTCMWHNLKQCRVITDKNGRLAEAKRRFDIPYPERLRQNIIERNMHLISGSLPSYDAQIAKACGRKDRNSINHRITEFMASYFDVIFALNRMTHPGEKRLVSICREQCAVLPRDFEGNLNSLFTASGNAEYDNIPLIVKRIAEELKNTAEEESKRRPV